MSFTEGSSNGRTSVSTDFQQTEDQGPAKTSIHSLADTWKETIFANNLNDLPNADT